MSEKESQNNRTILRLYEEVGNQGRLEVWTKSRGPTTSSITRSRDRRRESRA